MSICVRTYVCTYVRAYTAENIHSCMDLHTRDLLPIGPLTVCTTMHSILYNRRCDEACCLCSRECYMYIHTYVSCIGSCALLPLLPAVTLPFPSSGSSMCPWCVELGVLVAARRRRWKGKRCIIRLWSLWTHHFPSYRIRAFWSQKKRGLSLSPSALRRYSAFNSTYVCVCVPSNLYAEVCVYIILFCTCTVCEYSTCVRTVHVLIQWFLICTYYIICTCMCIHTCTCRLVSS